MMRNRTSFQVFILTVLMAVTSAQDAPDLPTLRELVPPRSPLSKRIALVLDVSSSMSPNVGDVLQIVRFVAGRPIDDVELALWTFDDSVNRWPGVPEENTPYGWARLPSVDALHSAENWLKLVRQGGGTQPAGALAAALAEDRADLSIIYVTDGEYESGLVEVTIREGQEIRKRRGLGEAVIATYGLLRSPDGMWADGLRNVAKLGHGGLWIPVQMLPVKTTSVAPDVAHVRS